MFRNIGLWSEKIVLLLQMEACTKENNACKKGCNFFKLPYVISLVLSLKENTIPECSAVPNNLNILIM